MKGIAGDQHVFKSSSAYTVTRWSLAIYFKLWWRLEGTTPAFEHPRLELIYHSPFFLALIVRSHCLMRDMRLHSAHSPFGALYFVWGLNDSTFGPYLVIRPSVATFPFHLSPTLYNLCQSLLLLLGRLPFTLHPSLALQPPSLRAWLACSNESEFQFRN